MGAEWARFAIAVLGLALGGALEELLPKAGGAGFPLLLATAVVVAARRPVAESALFAVAAGAVEDALSSLPAGTSVSYFLAMAAVSRFAAVPRATAALAFALYQLWLALWVRLDGAELCGRVLLALPLGFAAALAAGAALRFLERRAALDEG